MKRGFKIGLASALATLVLGGCTGMEEKETAQIKKTEPVAEPVKVDKNATKAAEKVAKVEKKAAKPEVKIPPARYDSYIEYPDAQALMLDMQKEGFSEAYLFDVLSKAKRQESILKAMSRPAEKSLNWGQYRKIFIESKRITQGVAFWKENKVALERAEKEYGVPAEIIVSIIGVETRYGRITGSYRVLDALATLGFDYPRRGKFFQGQLKEYLRLVQEEKVEVTSLKGSYAGAMGYGQFIPSSYRSFAIDFDNDGKRDIWNNKTDAIGSVANYFAEHKWKPGAPVISGVAFNGHTEEEWFSKGRKDLIPKVTLGEWQQRGVQPHVSNLAEDGKAILMRLEIGDDKQYWLGLHNFYVITRYNHSKLYAMAVYRLSEQIKAAYEKETMKMAERS